jgi:hypothetical protein
MPKPELLTTLLPTPDHPAAALLTAWLEAAPRFAAFAAANETKIRKKLRATDDETLRDALAELETAFLLLRDPRFAVAYETFRTTGRGPDLSVTFRQNLPFTVEVTRLRHSETGRDVQEKISDVACAKLHQFPPGVINLLLVFGAGAGVQPDAGQAMARLRERAAAGDDQFFARRAAGTARAFTRAARRLSGMLIRDTPGGAFALWENQTARHHLPDDLRRALVRAMGPADVL